MLKKLEKNIHESPQDTELQDQKNELLVDLNYTIFYPNRFKYISLYPPSENSRAERNISNAQLVNIWNLIKDAMAAGELPPDARTVAVEERDEIKKKINSILKFSGVPATDESQPQVETKSIQDDEFLDL
ncbi:rRNA-processing protein efg1 [Smittium mucronatum]|uniref:rRNA-processing protein EFG1 n=1 Tax=Smittium mucronatum TaxID=133383 RepID=A0A1R0GW70_9FUNG|nr:rRNA-processing protein efg1 [Smittium mucronatum]